MSKPKIIVATSPTGLIGLNGNLPWRKSADLKRFKKVTMGGVLIMGRATWESIGRPLPGRKTFVLSRNPEAKWEGVEVFKTLPEAIQAAGEAPIWIAGGSSVYDEGLAFCDELDVTVVDEAVEFPYGGYKIAILNWFKDGQIPGFKLAHEEKNPDDPTLTHRTYVRE